MFTRYWVSSHVGGHVAFMMSHMDCCNAILAGSLKSLSQTSFSEYWMLLLVLSVTHTSTRAVCHICCTPKLHWLDVSQRVQYKLHGTVYRCLLSTPELLHLHTWLSAGHQFLIFLLEKFAVLQLPPAVYTTSFTSDASGLLCGWPHGRELTTTLSARQFAEWF